MSDTSPALIVRRSPEAFLHDEAILAYAATLGPAVQRFADVLEEALPPLS